MIRILDSYGSLLALLLVNFFMLELIDDRRWGALVEHAARRRRARSIAISDPEAGERVTALGRRCLIGACVVRGAGRAAHRLDARCSRSSTCCRSRCSWSRRCRSRSPRVLRHRRVDASRPSSALLRRSAEDLSRAVGQSLRYFDIRLPRNPSVSQACSRRRRLVDFSHRAAPPRAIVSTGGSAARVDARARWAVSLAPSACARSGVAWTLIGIGLLLWTLGDTYYSGGSLHDGDTTRAIAGRRALDRLYPFAYAGIIAADSQQSPDMRSPCGSTA